MRAAQRGQVADRYLLDAFPSHQNEDAVPLFRGQNNETAVLFAPVEQ